MLSGTIFVDHIEQGVAQRMKRPRPARRTTGLAFALLAGCLGGCGPSGSKSPAAPAPVADAQAGDAGFPDVTFSMSGTVDGGGEAFACLYVQMPAQHETAISSAESHYTPGSHHFLVYRTSYKGLPDGGGAVHPCTDAEQITNITGSYYEAQTPDTRRDLPSGVAHVFQPGEVLLMTAHYLNPSQATLTTHVDFRLHATDPKAVKDVAGSVFFYNPQIDIPPMSRVTVTRTCPIDKDIHLALLWSHMHARGVGFVASTDDPTTPGGSELYESTTWSEPVARSFPYAPPVVVHAGSTITYSCTYDNPTPDTFVQGQSARTNEMCILHGMYWPRLDSVTELCFAGMSSMDVPAAEDGGTTGGD
jgi:hypothetical protein